MRAQPIEQPTLFDNAPRYPAGPGFKAAGPSQEAAARFAGRAKIIRAKVLDLITAIPDLSADEIAGRLGLNVLAVRPRVSELHRAGEIVHGAARATNLSGMTAWTWRAAPQQGASHAT